MRHSGGSPRTYRRLVGGRRRRWASVAPLALLVAGLAVVTTACLPVTGPGPGTGGPTPTPTPIPTPTPPAPGPVADLSHPLTGGNGPFIAESTPVDLNQAGYTQAEYAASGTATSYQAAGSLGGDGRWTLTPNGTAQYKSRIIVRRPAAATKFSGNVLVEWLNVSSGIDIDPEWASLSEELTRRGDIWVGVSAQRIGIEGGPVLVPTPGASGLAGKGLKTIDPARYGSLTHPGDGFSFDIYTQITRALRTGAALDGLRPQKVIAAGESQSAFALTTYYNGVQPLTRAFDAFFVHSRGAAGLPLVGAGQNADLAGAIFNSPATFRTDQSAPVLDVQTETDLTGLLNSAKARQPDSDRFRLWEVPGTAHADAHLIGPTASSFDCGVPINNGPMHLVVKAAWRALITWVTAGHAPATAPRIALSQSGSSTSVTRDADGIALGGIRTPPVDVPVDVLSGEPGPTQSTVCLLLGSTKPLPAARLAALYPSRADYESRYATSAAATIAAGYVLSEDRPALLAYSQPDRVSG
ncbi:alpha/beta hydrolase domain-containing protein [Frankia sp. AgKG'84/4]|uniref:alpha/beta hydrolase domain-containing protein n=1 Tax=Frankia sp. AgKG'84/4 TaxID=573490 RepID=UPI00200F5E15|nr:alpha/beta hydrolase domain-containing protein [Frankia sp. AgKG'84/4]MCL9795444.1 alpha/beta hydrolase domain-containing protein [Frankia sp. AgKG'84/4]